MDKETEAIYENHKKVPDTESWTLPVLSPLFWIISLIFWIFSAPWYFPEKTYEPLVLGIPAWLLWAILWFSGLVVFCIVAGYIFWKPVKERDRK